MFHRLSGVLLIGLFALQLSTGFFQASSSNLPLVKTVAALHRHPAVLCLLVFCVIFHALYGVGMIVMDLGIRRERLLFWLCTLLGSVLFVAFLVEYFIHVAA